MRFSFDLASPASITNLDAFGSVEFCKKAVTFSSTLLPSGSILPEISVLNLPSTKLLNFLAWVSLVPYTILASIQAVRALIGVLGPG